MWSLHVLPVHVPVGVSVCMKGCLSACQPCDLQQIQKTTLPRSYRMKGEMNEETEEENDCAVERFVVIRFNLVRLMGVTIV